MVSGDRLGDDIADRRESRDRRDPGVGADGRERVCRMEGERDEQDLDADSVRERERREAGEYLVLVNEPGVRSPFGLYDDRSCGCTSTSSNSRDVLNVESMRGKANADSNEETLLRGWKL